MLFGVVGMRDARRSKAKSQQDRFFDSHFAVIHLKSQHDDVTTMTCRSRG
jgi:hypothetical protein